LEITENKEQSFERARKYSRIKTKFTILRLFLTAVFLLILLLSGLSTYLEELTAGWFENFYLRLAGYMVLFCGVGYCVFLIPEFYTGYTLEHKFNLSNQTVLDWFKQDLKKSLLALVVLLIAAEVLFLVLRHFPNGWWFFATMAWLLLTIIIGKITPIVIVPLFYKCVPLESDEIKEKLLNLGKKCRVPVKDVFELGLSKETQKANAAVAGFGKNRRILLGDTLLNNYSADEIEAVFAHELGHIRMLHIWKIIAFGTVFSLLSFYLTYLVYGWAIELFAFDNIYDIAAFPLLCLILLLVGLILTPVQLAFSRRLEKQADFFALEKIQNPQNFSSAMTKLSEQNLSDPSPSKLEIVLLYDHPAMPKRLEYIQARCKDE